MPLRMEREEKNRGIEERGEREIWRDRGRDEEGRKKLGSHPPEGGAPNDTHSTSSPFLPLFPPPSPLSHLRLVLLQQPARACQPRVVSHVQDHHALLLPTDERAVCQALHHRQEVLVAVVARGHHGEGRPIVLFQHLEDDLQLKGGGGAELEKDGTCFLIGGESSTFLMVRASL